MDNNQLNETLTGIWETLTDEQKERARACTTTEELLAFAGAEKIELPDELLEQAAGGWLHYNFDTGEYEILNDKTTEAMDRVKGYYDARDRAIELGQSAEKVYEADLQALRDTRC